MESDPADVNDSYLASGYTETELRHASAAKAVSLIQNWTSHVKVIYIYIYILTDRMVELLALWWEVYGYACVDMYGYVPLCVCVCMYLCVGVRGEGSLSSLSETLSLGHEKRVKNLKTRVRHNVQ